MSIARKHPKVEPIPHDAGLSAHMGKWVAVKNGHVVAVAATSSALAQELRSRGIRRAVSQLVTEPSEGLRVGLG